MIPRIKVTATGLAEMRGRLERVQAGLVDMTPAIRKAAIATRDAAVMRFKTQGGTIAWQPNKRGGHTGIDTGRLWQSISVSAVSSTEATIGTNVAYARYFQFGTGIFAGHTPWTVEPVNGQALKFTYGGTTYVRRKVIMQGQPPRPFLYFDRPLIDKIRGIFTTFFLKAED